MKLTFIVLISFLITSSLGLADDFLDLKANTTRPLIIGVTGGTASGKSYFSKRLATRLGPELALHLSIDNYNNVNKQDEKFYLNGKPNWDHPSLVDWDLLREHLAQLKEGKVILSPIYSFKTAMPESYVPLSPKPVIVLEGIHALNGEIRKLLDNRVYLDVSEDLRFKRRLERDVKERGQTPEQVKEIFSKMANPMQKEFIEPTKEFADILIIDLDGEDATNDAIDAVVHVLALRAQGIVSPRLIYAPNASSSCTRKLNDFRI